MEYKYHFGLKVCEGKYGFKMTREIYSVISNKNTIGYFGSCRHIYADTEGKTYTEEWCKEQLEDSLINYDLNLKYFSSLSREEFNKELNNFLKKNPNFKEVANLNLYEYKSGYYVMVFDEYCQIYIGTSDNIKERIRTHWTHRRPFDRLLWPGGAIESSKLSVDSFRALNNTRLFVFETKRIYNHEDQIINIFSDKFVCNRLTGGKISEGGLIKISDIKMRELTLNSEGNLKDSKKP